MLTRTRNLVVLLAAFTLVAIACGEAAGPASAPETEAPAVNDPAPESESSTANDPAAPGVGSVPSEAGSPDLPPVGTLPDGPSALRSFEHAEFPPALVDTSLILSGGPPPDGIPSIDRPIFLPVMENLQLLEPAEPVVALEIDGDARAYPVRILIWHEIVNDTVGGVPVAVTYCPLCNSAATYRREVNGVETTFGTSGLLFASALVMYDRATESLWTHFDGRAVVGVLTGQELEAFASPLMSWDDFRSAHPDGLVLDETETGYSRAYGQNPYVGYDDESTTPFLFRGTLDDRAVAKERIVGVTVGEETKAYTLRLISGGEAKVTTDTIDGEPLAIFWKSGQASALDDGTIAEGRDVGTVGVFRNDVDGRALSFSAAGDRFQDAETGSTWLVTGDAVSGPLQGTSLERIPHLDTFWFAWATYEPDTVLVTELPGE